MIIGFVGSGHIGSTLAKLAIDAGHQVVMSNSRGPETLADLVAELGPEARSATAVDAAGAGEVVVVTIPLGRYREVPVEPLAGKVVIDTDNYYPERDGQIPELDDGSATTAGLLAAHLPTSKIVKAFNNIYYVDLGEQGVAAGSPDRRALPIAGDDAEAKALVAGLVDSFGFDVVDTGALTEGRRFERDTPAYVRRFDAAGLRAALAAA